MRRAKARLSRIPRFDPPPAPEADEGYHHSLDQAADAYADADVAPADGEGTVPFDGDYQGAGVQGHRPPSPEAEDDRPSDQGGPSQQTHPVKSWEPPPLDRFLDNEEDEEEGEAQSVAGLPIESEYDPQRAYWWDREHLSLDQGGEGHPRKTPEIDYRACVESPRDLFRPYQHDRQRVGYDPDPRNRSEGNRRALEAWTQEAQALRLLFYPLEQRQQLNEELDTYYTPDYADQVRHRSAELLRLRAEEIAQHLDAEQITRLSQRLAETHEPVFVEVLAEDALAFQALAGEDEREAAEATTGASPAP